MWAGRAHHAAIAAGNDNRRAPGYPSGTACHTRHKSEARAIPSLWRATPPAVSERSGGFTSLIANLLFLAPHTTPTLNQGPFAPPMLLGLLATTSLSVTSHSLVHHSRATS